ncbi:MAG TPA: thioredoxin [Desulfurococcaceae archaeon]|nr:thioredoxin [Desulfurococcaceae archaeon]
MTKALLAFIALLVVILGFLVYQYLAINTTSIPMPQTGVYLVKDGDLVEANLSKEPQQKGIVLVVLLSTTCPHCRLFWPTVYDVAKEVSGQGVQTFIVIIDPSSPEKVRDVIVYYYKKKYWDGSVPSIIVFKDGSYVTTWVGRISREDLLKRIESIK